MTGQLALDFQLREDARFASYIGTASSRICNLTGTINLWGESGSGRSHLLQACCHSARDRKHSAIYLYALKELDPDVLQGLESMAVVCLDDVDQVLGHTDWEEALFHLCNAVRDRQGTLVFVTGQPVAETVILLSDLRSRLNASLSVRTDNLSDDEKINVLLEKAVRRGFPLKEEVARFVITRSGRSMSHLLELLELLEQETLRRQKKATIPFVKEVLGL